MSSTSPVVVRAWASVVGFSLLIAVALLAIDGGARAQTSGHQPAATPAPATRPSASAQHPGAGQASPARTTQSPQGGSTLYPLSSAYQQPKRSPRIRRTITAHVVALDQPYMWNRLGASQPNAMVYALARDVVPTDYDPSKKLAPPPFGQYKPGKVRLREDKRPRPLVLRANEGDLLVVTFTNLLDDPLPTANSSVTRDAGFHVMGLELYREPTDPDGINNDASWIGTNPGPTGSVCKPGETKTYRYYARAEGTYLVHSFSSDSPGASQTSQLQSGLFGVVNVQPEEAEYYRSQVTHDDLGKATYYIWEKEQQELLQKGRTLAGIRALAARLERARQDFVYLPKQSGVYPLDAKTPDVTNMHLAVQLNPDGRPAETEIDGVKYPVYTLTTVVPAREDQVQLRTHKTTSVVLLVRPGDPPGMRRLFLDSGQQLINYVAIYSKESTYPSGQPVPFITPVLSMLHPAPDPVHFPRTNRFELVCGDLTAVITGPDHDRWPYSVNGPLFRENPSAPDRRQPYREFTIVYHYNFASVQAFPQLNNYASTGGDFFGINYGCAGIGAEILANRLGVGPMGGKDAVDLKFEEFFLSSWPCGDPAMVVDRPANAPWEGVTNPAQHSNLIPVFHEPSTAADVTTLNGGKLPQDIINGLTALKPPVPVTTSTSVSPSTPGLTWTFRDGNRSKYSVALDGQPAAGTLNVTVMTVNTEATLPPLPTGPKAKRVFYPDDPSNVYHSYMRDHVKFRVLNASEGITHVHHQHAHQWLHSPNSDNGQYLDSQTVVAGSGYTMEISHGGSGNLNYTVGDSIFHCHFYPHFAEGMWSLWRVHDVFEGGTKLDKDGIPDPGERWNRALPDGEIATGAPTPAIVPMPSLAMAPPPARVRLVDHGRRVEVEAENQAEIDAKRMQFPHEPGHWPEPKYVKNPGYPFFVPGVSGHRPPHPPLDYAWKEDKYGNPVYDPKTGKKVYLDGGLPRHVVLDGEIVRNYFTPWDFSKDFVVVEDRPPYKAKAGGLVAYELPQEGTAVEKAAMKVHSTRARPAYMPNGDPGNFILNGLPAVPGAPYAPPGVRGDGESNVNIRRYKAAVLQIDAVLNKKGWHFPQQRLLTLWQDVAPTVTGVRPPQPFFFRSNTDDTIEYWHTNLVPNYYEMDDFQVRTPTDVLGQHIHLVKFDVTSSDGAGNGFNYEDGTFSPQEVRERIAAINARGGIYQFDEREPFKSRGQKHLQVVSVNEAYPLDPSDPAKGSLFGSPPPFQNWDGAQTTVQRFDTDPTLNNDGLDRTVRSVFTHDHFSPSTHQQAGYYAALLVEPDNSIWKIPVFTAESNGKTSVKYERGGSRSDGGPTSWQANITTADPAQSYREFAFEFQDMQLAYLPGSTTRLRTPSQLPTPASLFTLSSPAQQEIQNIIKNMDQGKPIPPGRDDPIRANLANEGIVLSDAAILNTAAKPYAYEIVDSKAKTPDGLNTTYLINAAFALFTPNMNPGWSDPANAIAAPGSSAAPKVSPQLISFGTMGTYSVNYRNEPLPLRVANPVPNQPNSTDLAFAYASIERADPDLNVQPVFFAMDQALKTFIAVGKPKPEIIQAFASAGITLTNTPTISAQIVDDPVAKGWLVINPNPAGTSQTTYSIREFGPALPQNLYVFTQIPVAPRVFPPPVTPLTANPQDGGVTGTDPFTPMMRAYVNDRVQVRALAGAHMNEHSFLIHGVNFPFEPSYTNSGFQTTQAISLSEHFEMEFTVPARSTTQKNDFADYLYVPSANGQGQTSGAWGILRAFDGAKGDLGKSGSPVYLAPLDESKPHFTAPAQVNYEDRFNKAKARGQTQEYTIFATTAQQVMVHNTLYYNSRGQATQNQPVFQAQKDTATRLENPYALVYVDQDDLDLTDPKNPKLKGDMKVEPLILRANAGDWIKITLTNQFDSKADTFTKGSNVSSFAAGNPFIKLGQTTATTFTLNTTTSVGLHPQLVAYDITSGDGMNVGHNPAQTAGPTGNQVSYWYAGNLSFDADGKLVETPVEFGSVNLAPADPLIQHRKGLIGALVVEPAGSKWPKDHAQLATSTEYEYVYDSSGAVQDVKLHALKTRAVATVTRADGTRFRELVLAMQTDAYMYQGAKGQTPALVLTNAPALNYRTEPVFYRYAAAGFPPPPTEGTAARMSNALVTGAAPIFRTHPEYADPQTPLLEAEAGTPVRFRWIYPAGAGSDAAGSSQVPAIHGHVFQEEPYINDSRELGFNPLSQWMGGRFIVPGQTIDMLFPSAGGSFQVPGDYFYGTFIGQTTTATPSGGNGPSQALWGLFRVTKKK